MPIYQTLKIIALALVLAFGIQSAIAATWVAPTAIPISPNIAAPINVSSIVQTKLGGLTVGDSPLVTTGFLVPNGRVGIGTTDPSQKLDVNGDVESSNGFCIGDNPNNCIKDWPPAIPMGSAGVTSVSTFPGSNISLTELNGEVTITNTATGIIFPGATMVKLFCIANNPASFDVCPSGWTSAGVFDNGGHSWCESTTAPTSGSFIDHTGDAVLCYK
ncbi:MAG: hypothetical protein AAB726_01935 [Patescibacteria group bacterium]